MLDFELFQRCIQAMQGSHDAIGEYSKVFDLDFLDRFAVSQAFLDLLERDMDDRDHWISYWAYERDFGRDWDECTASEADGTPIILKTVRQLYDFLIEEAVTANENRTGWSDEDCTAIAKAYAEAGYAK